MYQRNSQGWLKHLDFILWDILVLQLAFFLAYDLRHGFFKLPYEVLLYRTMASVLVVLDLMAAVLFSTMRDVMKREPLKELEQTIKQAIIVLAGEIIYLFAVQDGGAYSRIVSFLTAVLHIVLGYLVRMLWKQVVRAHRARSEKASMILVAEEKDVPEVVEHIGPLENYQIDGLVLTEREAEGETICGIPVVANLDNAAKYLCRERVDEVLICNYSFGQETGISKQDSSKVQEIYSEGEVSDEELPGLTEAQRVEDFAAHCIEMAIPLHFRIPVPESNLGGKNFLEEIGGYSCLTTTANYATPTQAFAKRMLDILGGIVGSIIALLIMIIIGPIIKIKSPGPILFKQWRIGQNGKKFQMLKLRSMYMDAEERKKELMKENRIGSGLMFKLDFDPRIIGNEILPDGTKKTGIGEFIRGTSLDEFPQFFNVLLGDMSLVGTRPPTVDEWEKYEYHHRARLAIRPGITGMWQISGRSEITDFEEVVRLDTKYIQNWSLLLDLKILAKTVTTVIKRKGAM